MTDPILSIRDLEGNLLTSLDFGTINAGEYSPIIECRLWNDYEGIGSIVATNVTIKLVNEEGLEEGQIIEEALAEYKVGKEGDTATPERIDSNWKPLGRGFPLEADDIPSNTYRTVFLRIRVPAGVETAGFSLGLSIYYGGVIKTKVLPCIERDGVINGFDATLVGSSLTVTPGKAFLSPYLIETVNPATLILAEDNYVYLLPSGDIIKDAALSEGCLPLYYVDSEFNVFDLRTLFNDNIKIPFLNTTQEIIRKGMVVYPFEGGISLNQIEKSKNWVGIAEHDILPGQSGFVVIRGKTEALAVAPVNPGDMLVCAPSFSISDITGKEGLTVGGVFTGEEVNYIIKITTEGVPDETPDLFKFSNDGINWSEEMGVSTDWVELNNGIKVKFSSLTDWVVDDTWEFTASSTGAAGYLKSEIEPACGEVVAKSISDLDTNGLVDVVI